MFAWQLNFIDRLEEKAKIKEMEDAFTEIVNSNPLLDPNQYIEKDGLPPITYLQLAATAHFSDLFKVLLERNLQQMDLKKSNPLEPNVLFFICYYLNKLLPSQRSETCKTMLKILLEKFDKLDNPGKKKLSVFIGTSPWHIRAALGQLPFKEKRENDEDYDHHDSNGFPPEFYFLICGVKYLSEEEKKELTTSLKQVNSDAKKLLYKPISTGIFQGNSYFLVGAILKSSRFFIILTNELESSPNHTNPLKKILSKKILSKKIIENLNLNETTNTYTILNGIPLYAFLACYFYSWKEKNGPVSLLEVLIKEYLEKCRHDPGINLLTILPSNRFMGAFSGVRVLALISILGNSSLLNTLKFKINSLIKTNKLQLNEKIYPKKNPLGGISFLSEQYDTTLAMLFIRAKAFDLFTTLLRSTSDWININSLEFSVSSAHRHSQPLKTMACLLVEYNRIDILENLLSRTIPENHTILLSYDDYLNVGLPSEETKSQTLEVLLHKAGRSDLVEKINNINHRKTIETTPLINNINIEDDSKTKVFDEKNFLIEILDQEKIKLIFFEKKDDHISFTLMGEQAYIDNIKKVITTENKTKVPYEKMERTLPGGKNKELGYIFVCKNFKRLFVENTRMKSQLADLFLDQKTSETNSATLGNINPTSTLNLTPQQITTWMENIRVGLCHLRQITIEWTKEEEGFTLTFPLNQSDWKVAIENHDFTLFKPVKLTREDVRKKIASRFKSHLLSNQLAIIHKHETSDSLIYIVKPKEEKFNTAKEIASSTYELLPELKITSKKHKKKKKKKSDPSDPPQLPEDTIQSIFTDQDIQTWLETTFLDKKIFTLKKTKSSSTIKKTRWIFTCKKAQALTLERMDFFDFFNHAKKIIEEQGLQEKIEIQFESDSIKIIIDFKNTSQQKSSSISYRIRNKMQEICDEAKDDTANKPLINQKKIIILQLNSIQKYNLKYHIDRLTTIFTPHAPKPQNHDIYFCAYFFNVFRFSKNLFLLSADLILWKNVANLILHAYEKIDWNIFYEILYPIINDFLLAFNDKTASEYNPQLYGGNNHKIQVEISEDQLKKLNLFLAPYLPQLDGKSIGKTSLEKQEKIALKLPIELFERDIKEKPEHIDQNTLKEARLFAYLISHDLNHDDDRNGLSHDGYKEKIEVFIEQAYERINHRDKNNLNLLEKP